MVVLCLYIRPIGMSNTQEVVKVVLKKIQKVANKYETKYFCNS